MEYFYHEARKKQDDRQTPVSDSEFRYPGPKPKTKEAAIVMVADAAESACRTLADQTPAKVETLVHTLVMKRLQDGQFDECELTLRELSRIEASLSKSLAAHHHGRIAYPTAEEMSKANANGAVNGNTNPAGKQTSPGQEETNEEPAL
jgi:membrane-associated HD superfamily phosphohydrolase